MERKYDKKMPPFVKGNNGAILQWKLRNITYERMLAVSEMLAEYDLHYAQPPVLGMICHLNGATQKELADKMNTSAAAMSASLKRMQKSGLIKKDSDEADSRINKIMLTEKGKQIHKDTFGKTMEIDRQMLEGFTEEETEQLFAYLDRVQENISKILQNKTSQN